MAVARGVAAMLSGHWPAVEADWALHYHRDLLADCFGPAEIGVRKLRSLLEGLPPSSNLAKSADWWSDEDELAATSVELLADIALASASGVAVQLPKGKKYDPKRPLTWPRRGVKVEPKPAMVGGLEGFRSKLLKGR